MLTVYLDFDSTIVESNKQVINILNKRYGLQKSEDDLVDYGYNSIIPITTEEKLGIFESDDFFSGLEFKDGFMEFFNRYKDIVNFIISTKGTPENLRKKEVWVRSHISADIKFVGIVNDGLSKKQVDMKDAIQVDDCTQALDTNAAIKILYKDFRNYDWQQGYDNTNILVVNTWQEIEDIIAFYNTYDYKTLVKRNKGA